MYLLGVDAGGTKTTCIVTDSSLTILGAGQGGPGNYHVAGRDGTKENVDTAIRNALDAAGLDTSETFHAGFAIGALDTESDRRVIESVLDELAYVDNRRVENDVVVAHYAAMAGAPGVTVVAGTGAMAYGTDGAGADARASGWGWVFGDEGSGYDVARRGLQAASKAHDGRGEQTALLEAAKEHFDLERFEEIFPTVHSELEHPKRIASFAEAVAETAAAGDEVAGGLLDDAAAELADAAAAVAASLDLDPPVAVSCTGSFGTSAPMFGRFESALETRLGAIELVEPVDHPVVGTIPLLSDDTGIAVDRGVLDELDEAIEVELDGLAE